MRACAGGGEGGLLGEGLGGGRSDWLGGARGKTPLHLARGLRPLHTSLTVSCMQHTTAMCVQGPQGCLRGIVPWS
mgnify:CR=1 FL=1